MLWWGNRLGGSPWAEASVPAKPGLRGLQPHPLLRRCEAMPASLMLSRRPRTPATLPFGRKNMKEFEMLVRV